MVRIYLLFLLISCAKTSCGHETKDTFPKVELGKIIHESWLKMVIDLTKETPGYSAPVAARTFSYFSIGMYESSVEFLAKNQSLTGQLLQWERKTWNAQSENISYPIVANEVDYILTNYFYVNMPPSSMEKVEENYTNWNLKLKKKTRKKFELKSKKYAQKLAAEIIAWSKLDSADNCWNKNFPTRFQEKKCIGCWTKTYPGFERALQPYWGQNRPMLYSNTFLCEDLKPIPFSIEPKSKFYEANNEIAEFHTAITQEQKDIAQYWDDSPGISGTPVGHLFSIALDCSKTNGLSLAKELEMFVSLGVALNDAVIESWRLKYLFSAIRPITYIQQHIDPKFNTAIPTPPFPEFPSGHSFQSGAGSEILKHFLGDTLSFTDETNVKRLDINGSARTFNNFTEMSEEMSLSRFYGGIHYSYTLSESLSFGRKIGKNTISKLQFTKE